jgi:hypothetical protein
MAKSMPDLEGVVAVEGLAEFRRDLRRMDPALAKGLRESIKDAARIVAEEAESRAPVGRTGLLKSKIRPRVKGDTGLVVALAKRKSPKYPSGYPYAKRIEYQDGGVRGFLRPALVAKQDEVIERMDKILDDLADIWDNTP